MSHQPPDSWIAYGRPRLSSQEMEARAEQFLQQARLRRSVRHFSSEAVPRSVIENCLRVAGTAPSGANQQPWHFVAIGDPETKSRIRVAAEAEEYQFYHGRAPQEWLQAVAPMGTTHQKPFLESAPWLIAIFARTFGQDSDGERRKHYYVSESVGIATGMLIAALNDCGLSTLTHTPSPMRFLNQILQRPDNERPFLLLVVGVAADDCQVPNLSKKALPEFSTFIP